MTEEFNWREAFTMMSRNPLLMNALVQPLRDCAGKARAGVPERDRGFDIPEVQGKGKEEVGKTHSFYFLVP